jgi:methionyl-tRNA synthetase
MGSRPYEPLVLPFDVPANEFLNLEGQKISGSRNWAVWMLDCLSRYDPDALRYYLVANMPEFKDADWDWDEFFHHNNDELVATWGNLANRVLTFTNRHWEGRVPDPGALTGLDLDLLSTIQEGFMIVGDELESVHLRAALGEAMRLAKEVNKYLDQTAPWTAIKTDRPAAARAIYTALQAIDSLKILFSPFLPFTCERLHTFLGYTEPLFGDVTVDSYSDTIGEHRALRYHPEKASGRWEPGHLAPGKILPQPEPLFKKLDAKIVEEERARLGKS